MKRIDCNECKCNKCLIKLKCTGELSSKLNNNKYLLWYKKGDYIFREGEPVYGVYFIQQGAIKIATTSLPGREQIVRLVTNGQIFGHRALGRNYYYFNAVAMTDTLVCFIENELFYEACMNCPSFSTELMFFFASELGKAEIRMKNQAQMNIREKVAMAFLYSYEVFGVDDTTNKLKVSLNRQDIADIAGTTAEQVTRQLNDFEYEKLISRNKRDISFLNIHGMEEIVCDYCIE